jgi:hypothetical protein
MDLVLWYSRETARRRYAGELLISLARDKTVVGSPGSGGNVTTSADLYGIRNEREYGELLDGQG